MTSNLLLFLLTWKNENLAILDLFPPMGFGIFSSEMYQSVKPQSLRTSALGQSPLVSRVRPSWDESPIPDFPGLFPHLLSGEIGSPT